MANSDPFGIKVWHDSKRAIVDICFVHGLFGDRDSTWAAEKDQEPWPQKILAKELGYEANLFTYGYDAYLFRRLPSGSSKLREHAEDLLTRLTAHREKYGTTGRPLIFVVHSLGGLLCKVALIRSRAIPDTRFQAIYNNTRAIAFMGTPHKGSWLAHWGKIPTAMIRKVPLVRVNSELIKLLGVDNQLLDDIHIQFLDLMRASRDAGKRGISVACFYEMLAYLGAVIVPKESATFEGYLPIGIHADHKAMVRFPSISDSGFQSLLAELRNWASSIVEDLRVDPGRNYPGA